MPSFVRSALLVDSHHPFPEPLLPVTEPGDAETSDLQAAITAWERSGRPDSFDPLEYFLAEHPQSPWSFSLTANMGILAARQAQFAKALHWLETAYELGKTQEESSLRRLADRALGELLRLYARFGDAEALERWLHEAEERPMRGRRQKAGRQHAWPCGDFVIRQGSRTGAALLL
jgi:hypothetical protein